MPHIDHIIPASVLEVIPARIYTILKRESDWQVYQFGSTMWQGVNFMSERTAPIDKVETDMITIMTAKGHYDNQSPGSMHALPYTFILDFITKKKTTATKRGDQGATERLIKLMMAVRYILMSPLYIRLEFTDFIEGTTISDVQIYKDERTPDTSDIAMGQLIFSVNCEEVSSGNSGVLLGQADTDIRIELTSQGYQYQS